MDVIEDVKHQSKLSSKRRRAMKNRLSVVKANLICAVGLAALLAYPAISRAEDQRPLDPYSNCTPAQQSIPGAAACTGFLYCLPQSSGGTDVMCCHANANGGKDCDYVGTTAFTQPKGGVRAPVGSLQNAPVNAPTKAPTPKAPITGINKQ
jgi:hypothetical protein